MRLNEYLEKHGIKALHIARNAGLPPSTVTRFLRGERGLSLESAFKIHHITNGEVSLNELRLLGSSPPHDGAPPAQAGASQ